MSAQGGQFNGTKIKSGEERRFREGAASVGACSMRHGMYQKRLAGGTFLEPRKQRSVASSTHEFKVRSFSDSGTWRFRVEPGSYEAVIPTIDGVALNLDPDGLLDDGEKFVYLKASHELLSTEDYVYSGFLNAAVNSGKPEIVVLSAEQADPLGPNTTGIYYILLATFQDGVKTGQYIRSSIFVEVADDGTASSSASCAVTVLV